MNDIIKVDDDFYLGLLVDETHALYVENTAVYFVSVKRNKDIHEYDGNLFVIMNADVKKEDHEEYLQKTKRDIKEISFMEFLTKYYKGDTLIDFGYRYRGE
ncbi:MULTISPECIES: hypothetical protein [unclassified Sutcliffiella]|uniref:hypothetical protein n=1 Tax=unclassified Sutcliffiella TaxID=2837532 RepID=UPI0030D244F7